MAKTNIQNPVQGLNQSPGTSQTPSQSKSLGTGPGQGQQPSNPKGPAQPGLKKKKVASTAVPNVLDQKLHARWINLKQCLVQVEGDPSSDFNVTLAPGQRFKYSEILQACIDRLFSLLPRTIEPNIAKITKYAVSRLRYIDDTFLQAVVTEEQVGIFQAMLRDILGDDNLVLKSIRPQVHLNPSDKYRSVIIDILCVTDKDELIIIEVQKQKRKEIIPRSLFESFITGYMSLKPNKPYTDLKPLYVVYLTDTDVTGKHKFIHWEWIPKVFCNAGDSVDSENKPLLGMVYVNCNHAVSAVKNANKQGVLYADLAKETDEEERAKIKRKIDRLDKIKTQLDSQRNDDLAPHPISEKHWNNSLVWACDFMANRPEDISNPDMASLMRQAKTPDKEGFSLMSSVQYVTIRTERQKAIKQNNLNLAAKALAANFDPDSVQTLFSLTDEELRDLLANSNP